jgi:hypothetical protein
MKFTEPDLTSLIFRTLLCNVWQFRLLYILYYLIWIQCLSHSRVLCRPGLPDLHSHCCNQWRSSEAIPPTFLLLPEFFFCNRPLLNMLLSP